MLVQKGPGSASQENSLPQFGRQVSVSPRYLILIVANLKLLVGPDVEGVLLLINFPDNTPDGKVICNNLLIHREAEKSSRKKKKRNKNTYELKTFTKRGLHYSHYAMLRIRIGLDPNCFAGSVLRSDQDINSNFFTIDFVLVSFSF